MILLAARFGGLADRHGPRLFLTLGPALIGAGHARLRLVDGRRPSFWTYGIVGLLLFSLGLAMMVAPITATALKSAPERYAGIASGVNSTVSRLGSLHRGGGHRPRDRGSSSTRRTDVADAVPLAKDQTAPGAPRGLGGRLPGGHGPRRRPRVRGRGRRRGRDLEPRGARRAAPPSANQAPAPAESVSAPARSRQRATASSRVSPEAVKIASR